MAFISEPASNLRLRINPEVKVVSIVGARPQFIKAAAVSRILRKSHVEVLVHTGQHYDYEMSGIFFDGLDLPAPNINLGVGSGLHGEQTAAMLSAIERVLATERPDFVLIYGDTNSTLAAALAASKLSVPVAHVEAGLRSFNRRMPEEINRVVADHLSTLLLCPSGTATKNLAAEGITANVHVVGDVMFDILMWAVQRLADKPSDVLTRFGLAQCGYVIATMHRSENTDDPAKMEAIVAALNALQDTIVFPVHPRARKLFSERRVRFNPNVKLIDPLGYVDMIALARGARAVLTDSGGLQKEAYWLSVPCLTMRDETEWVETVAAQWNVLVGAHTQRIIQGVRAFQPPPDHPPLYGDGTAAKKCVELLGSFAAGLGTAQSA